MVNTRKTSGIRTGAVLFVLALFFSGLCVFPTAAGAREQQETLHARELPAETASGVERHGNVQLTAEDLRRIGSGYLNPDSVRGLDTMSLAVLHFRVNSTTLERDFMNNAATLDMVHRIFSDRGLLRTMEFITITAGASPEGNTADNERLAEGRAKAIKSYIMWKFPFMDRNRIFTFSIGEDWDGLRRMVYDDPRTPYRSEVLDVLDGQADGDAKRAAIKRLGRGAAWKYISRNMLPKLRGGVACMIYIGRDAEPRIIVESRVDTVFIDRVTEVERIVKVEQEPVVLKVREPYYWAIKTNMLYNALLLPDLAMEFSIGRKLSVEFGGQWAWWNTPNDHRYCWRIQVAGVEARRWLGDRDRRTPLSGHYLGVYGMAGTYDVRFGGNTGYLSDMSFSTGLSYGYSLRMARSWNIEFGLAVGYMGGRYDTYSIFDEQNGIFYRDGRFYKNYFGPTKAKVSIMWLPGGKNPGKGGKERRL